MQLCSALWQSPCRPQVGWPASLVCLPCCPPAGLLWRYEKHCTEVFSAKAYPTNRAGSLLSASSCNALFGVSGCRRGLKAPERSRSGPGKQPHSGTALPRRQRVPLRTCMHLRIAEPQLCRSRGLHSGYLVQMDLGEEDEDAFMTPDEEDDLEVLQRQRESAQASASRAAVQADEWSSESCAPKPCCTPGFPRGRVVPGVAIRVCRLQVLLALWEPPAPRRMNAHRRMQAARAPGLRRKGLPVGAQLMACRP